MPAQTVSNAVAKQSEQPTDVVEYYKSDFAKVLPTTLKPETFVRLAQGVLRRNPKLMYAARMNPGSLLGVLLDAARLGHEPGTDDYYLRPIGEGEKASVQGIEGYRGVIKRMFNSGTVAAVIVETVHEGEDFSWEPDVMKTPTHRVPDWFNRGEVKGAYAYAIFKDGAVSKVVIVGKKRIERAMGASDSLKGRGRPYSPWTNDVEKMVLKTAAHDLEPWVPKSAEAQIHQVEVDAAAAAIAAERPEFEMPELPGDERRELEAAEHIDLETGEVEPVDAEVVAEGAHA